MKKRRRWISRDRWEQDLSEELRFHIERQTGANIAAGMSRDEARRQATLQIGAVEGVKETCREETRGFWLETLWSDIRFGLRTLRKSPGFTSVAVVTLALGIGANTAIFSLINALILRELPVRDPGQLVQIATLDSSGERGGVSLPMFQEIAQHQQVFSEMFGWWGEGIFNVEINGESTTGDIWGVTGNFYSALGVEPYLGRLLAPEDVDLRGDAPPQAAVLGYGFWQRQFGGDPNVIGKPLRIEDHPFTIVGITQKWFTGMTVGAAPDVTVPLNAKPLIEPGYRLDDRSSFWVSAGGRLKSGDSLEKARAQIETLWPAVRAETTATALNPQQRREFLSTRIQVDSGARGYEWFLRSQYTRPLYILLGLAGLILLIACVNLANLLLARAASRTHEMEMRIALGASRWRVTRQLLTESLLLSLAGATFGLALAYWGSRALANSIWDGLVPLTIDFRPDWRILAFTIGAAMLTGILFGLAPARRATRQDPLSAMQQTARVAGGRSGKMAKLLICTQVALSLVLLAGAGLFVRSLSNLRSIQPGYRSDGVLLAQLYPRAGAQKTIHGEIFYPELIERVSALPGVESASISDLRPAWGFGTKEAVFAEPAESAAKGNSKVNVAIVSPRFFETLGMSIIEGRVFSWRDEAHSAPVAILSRTLAREMFPAGGAIGRRIRVGTGTERRNVEVVGIVNDARIADVHDTDLRAAYIPFLQDLSDAPWSTLEVKAHGNPGEIAFALRKEINQLGQEWVLSTRTLDEVSDIALSRDRVIARISAFFGVLALVLASLGIYGLISYFVRGRTREIGIRMALGAQKKDVGGMVVREALLLVLAGVAIGLPCALAATRVFASLLYGLSPDDPVTMGLVAATLLLVGAAAAWLPARRAMRVDPMVALRYE